MPSPHDRLFGGFRRFSALYHAERREDGRIDREAVELRAAGASLGKLPAIVYEKRQDTLEEKALGGSFTAVFSEYTREVEFDQADVAAAGLKPAVKMGLHYRDEKMTIRRVVSETASTLRVEAAGQVQHTGGRAAGAR
ncbi:MAG: hypothetical protein AAF805_00110 [Planctomycetota bacterium]